jgi:hypothetical protein
MIAGQLQRRARGILKNIFRICPTTHDRVRARPMTPPRSRGSDPSALGNQLNLVSTKTGQFHAGYVAIYGHRMERQQG